MRFSASLVLALTLSTGCSGAGAQSRGPADRPQYLYVWAGAVDSTQSDFLAVIDATPQLPRYGDVIATIPVGAVTNAHHIEMASDRILLANGFDAGRTFRFDLRDPRKPLLAGELAIPVNLAHAHSFVRLANGHLLATYQYQADDHGRPGGLAEHDERGKVVRWKSAVDPAVKEFVRPYSLVTVPALDRIVSTGVDMHGKGLSRVVQVWRLSDLTLIKSLLLSDGPRGDEGLQSFEPRLLPDGRTVIVSTLKCGLHRIDGLEGQNPSATLIHTFADQRCDMPAAIGRYWVQTLSTKHAVVSLDMSDPARPVEVSRMELGSDNRPHWLAIEPGGIRLVLTGYRDMQYRVLMLRIDPASGRLSMDTAFRDEGSTEAGLSFNRSQWPHRAGGPARPHGAIFGAYAPVPVQQHAGHPLGTVHFPITCSEQAQVAFNRAVALLHHMTYPQARVAFQEVAATEPGCAMAHWGIAMTVFQPLWPTRPGPEALQRGWDAVQKAKALHPPSERERLFIAAAEAFFLEPASPDYWLRIRRWEQASEKVHAALPDDSESAAFHALAHLATAPADRVSRAHSDRAAAILLAVYERNPDHPGAMHYLVHANDVPGRERELLEITRKYDTSAPRNPHALHMPTHIYTRLGDWTRVIQGNLRAAEAALEHPAGDRGQFVWDEFPHAIEYLVYAHLQRGDDGAAAAELQRLRATARLEPTLKTAFHIASTQARYALERRAWNEAAAVVPREPATLNWDRFAWPEAIAQFARGLGAALTNKLDDARAAVARLEQLDTATTKAGEDLFARNIRVLRLELRAWLAHVEGQRETSVALMREAAALEASTPKHAVTPGPTLPAEELLADLLMEQKQPAEALAAYRRSLAAYPKRFNGLLGAARAARALGDESLARTFYQELLGVADGGTRQPALKEAQSFVANR